jgi:tetratricopeptide (TPR) repeat protein
MSTAAPPSATEIQYAARQLAEGRPQEAIEVLERLARDFPAYVSAQVLLAKSYQTTGRTEEALAAWHQAYQLMPGSPLIARQRQRLLEGDWEDPITSHPAPESPRHVTPEAPTAIAEPPSDPEPPSASEPPSAAANGPLDSVNDGPDEAEAESPVTPFEGAARRSDPHADDDQEDRISDWDEAGGLGEPDPFDAVGRMSFSPGAAQVPNGEPGSPTELGPQSHVSGSREEDEEDAPWVDLKPSESGETIGPGEGWRVLGEEDFSAARRDQVHEVEVTPPETRPRSSRPRPEESEEGADDWSPLGAGDPEASGHPDKANFGASGDWLDVQGDLAAEDDGAEDILQQSEDLDSLIEQLENAPRIKPDEDPFARAGDTELNHEVVTVTLARIYENQKQFTAAAHVYERLAQEEPERAEEFRLKADEMRRLAQS